MPSFDIVSKLNAMEVDNALVQAQKEVAQRFDFKNSNTEIEKGEMTLVIKSNTEERVDVAREVLYTKLSKRGVSLTHLEPGEVEPSGKGVKQTIKLIEGIAQEKAKQIVTAIKGSKLKISAAINGELVRVTGKDRDELQKAIQFVKAQKMPIELQFINFRD